MQSYPGREENIDEDKIRDVVSEIGLLTFDNKLYAKSYPLPREVDRSELSAQINKKIPILNLTNEDFKRFKAVFGQNAFGEFIFECDVREFNIHDDEGKAISRLKFSSDHIQAFGSSGVVTVVYASQNDRESEGEKKYFVINRDSDIQSELMELFHELRQALPQMNIDERYNKYMRQEKKAKDPTYWNDEWKHKNIQDSYDGPKGIDEATIKTFIEHIISHYNPGDSLTVMDVGGGFGRLAMKLLSAAQSHGINLQYILIEPSLQQCEEANEKFQNDVLTKDNPPLVYHGFLKDFIHEIENGEPVLSERLSKKTIDPKNLIGNVHVVVSSGGPLNTEVVSATVAKDNLTDFKKMIGGVGSILATGLTPLAVSKKEFKEPIKIQTASGLQTSGFFKVTLSVTPKKGSHRPGASYDQTVVARREDNPLLKK